MGMYLVYVIRVDLNHKNTRKNISTFMRNNAFEIKKNRIVCNRNRKLKH